MQAKHKPRDVDIVINSINKLNIILIKQTFELLMKFYVATQI